jgi:hypothetical protein
MLSRELRASIRGDVLKQRILWVASLSSIGVYCVVALVVARQGGDGMALPAAVGWALLAVGYAMLAAAFCVRRILLSPARVDALLENAVDVEELARDPNTAQIRQERLALLQKLPEDDVRLCVLARASFKPCILALALVDVCAIIGLVLAILQRDFQAILPFAAAAAAVSIVHFPNLESYLERARIRRRHERPRTRGA